MRTTGSWGVLVASALATCTPTTWRDPARHVIRQVHVADGVSLEVLDWGGSGPMLVLLAGLGDTAHVFDDFAPAFVDRWHVIGITRRGFGASMHPTSGYDLAILGTDIVHVLDALHVDRAVFAGHSIAGEELSWLAEKHPERLLALIYLDAAYDRTELRDAVSNLPSLEEVLPTEADKANPKTFSDFRSRTLKVSFPLGEILASCRFGKTGHFEGFVAYEGAPPQIMLGIVAPAYDRINVPALAFYMTDFPGLAGMPEVQQKYIAAGQIERARFAREVRKGRVVELPHSNHYVFLSARDEVVRDMRAFLGAI